MFSEALEILDKEKHPYVYALTKKNLGDTYSLLSKLENKEYNLEKAINFYKEASKIFKKNKYLYDYVNTKGYLGDVYFDLSQVKSTKEELNKAIESFKEALSIAEKHGFTEIVREMKEILKDLKKEVS